MTVVVMDTSPLQAFWRGGVLPLLPSIFSGILLPRPVWDETLLSHATHGVRLVPNLMDHPSLSPVEVDREEMREMMMALFSASQKKYKRRFIASRTKCALVGGKVHAWMNPRHRIAMKEPDLSVLCVASKHSAQAVLDDRRAIKAAGDLRIPTVTTIEVLRMLEGAGSIAEADSVLEKILSSGYNAYIRK